mgnify:CR=1 FL=1
MLLAFLNKQCRVFGEALDITLGQLLDQFGRSIGFAATYGKNIEESVKEMIFENLAKLEKRSNKK